MMHPHTRLLPVDDTDFGVFATRPLPRGTLVWVRDPLDQVFTSAEVAAMHPLQEAALRHWTYWEADTDALILLWDHARYTNHSCEANCRSGGYEFEVAVRDIAAGEQLTDDYASFGYAVEFACRCGAPGCRGRVRAGDAAALVTAWDTELRDALAQVHLVEQPLWDLLTDPDAIRGATEPGYRVRGHRV